MRLFLICLLLHLERPGLQTLDIKGRIMWLLKPSAHSIGQSHFGLLVPRDWDPKAYIKGGAS